jgi:enamine deaminase RidA (YjgF/YER057c/UK114 family)
MDDWAAFNRIYVGYFRADRLPARSAFAAKALALGARVEMECWAWDRAGT